MTPNTRTWLPFVCIAAVLAATTTLLLAQGTLTLSALWPLSLMAVLPWAWHVHVRGRSSLSRPRALLVGATRVLILFALVLALCEPRTTRTDDRAVVVFAVDASDSVQASATQAAIRFALDATARKQAQDEVGLVFFARNAGVELPPGTSLPFESINVGLDRSGTDIGEALATAAALLPPGRPGRIVLVSDGADNQGHLDAALDDLRSRGVPVDALPIDYAGDKEVWIEKVELPMLVKLGETIEPGIVVAASADGSGELVLTDNDVEVARQRVAWQAGKTRLSAALPMRAAGYHEFRAHLEADAGSDFWSKNNEGLAAVHIVGRGRVLVVHGCRSDGADAATLAQALRAQEREVDVIDAAAVPSEALRLLSYDAVVLVDAPREDFTVPQMEAIRDAVFHQGSGLLALGSPASFGPGGFGHTPIEEAMPVSTDLPDKKQLPKGALAIVLHTCEFPEGNTWAKRITLQAMKVLHPRDLVGVLAYDFAGRDSWLFHLTPAAEYEQLAVQVNAAQIGDMPGFEPTMKLAHDELTASDAAMKHVIIISDGDPQPPPAGLLAKYQAARITVSTVTVFPHGNQDTGTMQAIARATGGRHYVPSKAEQLPAIFVKEAKTARTPAIVEKTFTPGIVMPSPILKGIDALPPLRGLVLTQPKARALVVLDGPDPDMDDPVLVQWRYGVGAAAAFTSDLGGRWGKDWVGWDHYRAFVHQLVGDVSRQPRPQRLFARALSVFGTGLLQVEDHGPDDALLDLRAELRGPQGTTALELTQVAPRRYEARFPLPTVGRYELTVAAGDERTHAGFVVPYGPEYARFRSDLERLRQVTAATGGRTLRGDEGADEVFARPATLPKTSRPWLVPLLWAAAVLLLFEIAFRRVQIGWRRRDAQATPSAATTLLERKRASDAERARRDPPPERRAEAAAGTASAPTPAAPAPASPPPPPPPNTPAPSGGDGTTARLLARKRARDAKPPTEQPTEPPDAPPPEDAG
ncbi:MAG: VWA domain-containing protein [Planctomycetota bacterium]